MPRFTIQDSEGDELIIETLIGADDVGLATVFPVVGQSQSVVIKAHHWQLLYDWIKTNCPVEDNHG